MKSIKNLLIPAAALLILVVVAIVYFAVPKKEDVAESNISNESTSVLNISNGEIQRFAIHKKDGDDIAFTSEVSSDSSEQIWTLEGEDVELSQSAVSSYVSILSSYVANSTIIEPSDLTEYSLTDPDFTIEITKFDGTVTNIYIGAMTFDNSGVYFSLDGDANVYITAPLKREYCEYSLSDFVSTKILEIDLSQVSTVEFVRDSDNTDIITVPVEKNGSFEHPGFNVVEPFECPTNENYENLVEFFATLQVSSYEDISEADLSSYGLNDPAFEMIFTLDDDSEITISLSNNMNGKYYGVCSEVEGYFSLNELQFNGIETPLMSLLDSYIAMYDASDVSSISCTYGEQSFEFDLNVHTSMSEEGATATLNGRNAYVRVIDGGRSYAAILFESIVGMQYSGIDTTAEPALEPAMSFSIVTNDYDIVAIDFVERDSGSYYVFVDGEYTGFYCLSSELFAYGGNDPFGYGSWAAYELTVEAIDNSINGVYTLPVANNNSEVSEEA